MTGTAPHTACSQCFAKLLRPGSSEQMALADVRLYGVVCQVEVPGQKRTHNTREVLKGHMIAFFQDAPERVSKIFDKARINETLSNVQIQLVSDTGHIGVLERDALKSHVLRCNDLQMRPHVLYNNLLIRNALRPHESMGASETRSELPTFSEMQTLVRDWSERLWARAHVIQGDTRRPGDRPSDIANVRDVGWDAQHADAMVRGDTEVAAHDQAPAHDCTSGGCGGCGEGGCGYCTDGDGPFMQVSTRSYQLEGIQSMDWNGVSCQESAESAQSIFAGAISLLQADVDDSDEADHGGDADGGNGGDGHNSPEVADVAASLTSTTTFQSRRHKIGINEFTANRQLLYGSFWHLFPLKSSLLHQGPLNITERRHMCTQFHNMFAQHLPFQQLLANQVQRHEGTRGVHRFVKTHPAAAEAYAAALADRDAYIARLRAANDSQKASKEQREALKEVYKWMAGSGAQVPWTATKKRSQKTRLYANTRACGPASNFLTIAIDDVHQPTVIRLCYRAGCPGAFPSQLGNLNDVLRYNGGDEAEYVEHAHKYEALRLASLEAAPTEEYEFKLTEEFVQMLATKNPVATMLIFEELVINIFEHLVGLAPCRMRKPRLPARERKRGFAGKTFGWSYVCETNQRKAMHLHAMLYGGATPALLAAAAGHKSVQAAVLAALDSMLIAEAPLNYHVLHVAHQVLWTKVVRHSYLPDEGYDAAGGRFRRVATFSAMFSGNHMHRHQGTCHKGKSGKCGCRMCRPAGHPIPKTRVVEVRARSGPPEDAARWWRCPYCGCEPDGLEDIKRRLSIDAFEPSEGEHNAERSNLSYELRRPLLTKESAGSATVRWLLDMPRQKLLSLVDDESACIEIVGLVGEELMHSSDLLVNTDDARDRRRVLPEVGHMLVSSILGESEPISGVKARKLVEKWGSMHCQNADLVEFSDVLCGNVRGTNAPPLITGAGHAAKAIGSYVTDYMGKDDYKLDHSAKSFADVRNHVEKYRSLADDTGTAGRTMVHFLERSLNKALGELSSTQAAAINLGIDDCGHSHEYENAYVWDAMRLLLVIAAGGKLLRDDRQTRGGCVDASDSAPAPPGGAASKDGSFDNPNYAESDDDSVCADDDDSVDANDDEDADEDMAAALADECPNETCANVDESAGTRADDAEETADQDADVPIRDELDQGRKRGERTGVANSYSMPDGSKELVAQADHYAYRDPRLHAMNLLEFIEGMEVEPLTSAHRADVAVRGWDEALNERNAHAGAPKYFRFRFTSQHPLSSTHYIRARKTVKRPIFCGDKPPRPPPLLKSGARSWLLRLNANIEYAKFFSVLFVPWHVSEAGTLLDEYGDPFDSSPRSFGEWIDEHELVANGNTWSIVREHARGRLFRLLNAGRGLKFDPSKAKMMTRWRTRNRHLWTEEEKEVRAMARAAAGDSAGKRAQDAIDREVERSASRCVTEPRTRAAAEFENWMDTAFSGLAAAQHQLGEITCKDRSTWPGTAGVPAKAVHDAGVIKDIVKRIKQPRAQKLPDAGGIDGVAQRYVGDDGSTPPEFVAITPDDFDIEKSAWLAQKNDVEKVNRAAGQANQLGIPHPPLNPKQREIARELLSVIRILHEHRHEDGVLTSRLIHDASLRTMYLIQGLAGAGKSELFKAMNRIMQRHDLGCFVVTAWMNVASAPFGTPSVCKLLNISHMALKVRKQMNAAQVATMRSNFSAMACEPDALRVFVVDEISFVEAAGLWQIDQQLRLLTGRPDVNFGGVLFIAGGDFWQKAPPKAVSLAKLLALVDAPVGTAPRQLAPTSADGAGLDLFRKMRRKVLTQPMRTADDVWFQEELLHMRSTCVSQPVRLSFVNRLKAVSVKDVVDDPTWAFATIGVWSNKEAAALNLRQARAFAKTYNLVLVLWAKTLGGRAAQFLDADEAHELIKGEHEPGLLQIFVRGAPARLLDTINATKSLCKGTPGRMHSLVFDGEVPPHLVAALEADRYDEVWLDEPPLSVNFVPNIKGDTSYIDSVVSPASTWNNVGFMRPTKGRELTNVLLAAALMRQISFAPEEWDAFGITDLQVNDFVCAGGCWYFQAVAVVGETVVPVPFDTRLVDDNDAYKCSSMWAAQKGVPIELQYSSHRIGVFFAGTDYGLQGATEPKLIVSAARKPFKPAVDMEGFYVFVSRVNRFANLRVLELPSRHTCFYKRCNCPYKSQACLDNLLELRHDPELQVWNEGYDANGEWSIELARRTAGQAAAERVKAKQKATPKMATAVKSNAPSLGPTKRKAAPINDTSSMGQFARREHAQKMAKRDADPQ